MIREACTRNRVSRDDYISGATTNTGHMVTAHVVKESEKSLGNTCDEESIIQRALTWWSKC